MLKKFINLYEGRSELPVIAPDTNYPGGIVKTINVTMKPTNLSLPIDVNTEESLLSFRNKIATLFDIKLNEFIILTRTGVVETAGCDHM